MAKTEIAGGEGIFQRLASVVVRWPLLVIGMWIGFAIIPLVTFPPLAEITARQQVAQLPDDAPVMVTAKAMTDAYHEAGSDNIVLVVLTNEKGLGPADEATYRTLIGKLQEDKADVKSVQDFLSTPPLREVLQSKDNKAWSLPVTLVGSMGSPEGRVAYYHVADVVKKTVAGSTLTANVTGPAATVSDMAAVGEHDLHFIEMGTAFLVLLILLVVYRNVITMLLPLITIVISLCTAQGVLAGLAEAGLRISPQTLILMSVVMIGAGVDYAVFLISRYHDYVRQGIESKEAVARAMTSIGKVIAASAATVAVTFLAMVLAKLPVFTTVGPAISLSIAIGFCAAVTLLPAIIVLAGPRGWIKPRRALTNNFWRRSGIRIVRRPKLHLAVSLLLLIFLASSASFVRYNYDDRKTLPTDVESVIGYNAMARHFPLDSLMPQFLFIQSSHDLRSPQALADLEQMARRVSQVPDVGLVRGITRPTGEPFEQAKATYQAGEVGSKLNEGSQLIEQHNDDLNTLTGGAHTLADSLGQVRGQVTSAMATAKVLVDALTSVQTELGGGTTLQDLDNAAKLIDGMRSLGGAIGLNFANLKDSFDWAPPVLTALDGSLTCNLDPSCRNSREELRRIVTAMNDGTFDRFADLAQALQSTQQSQTLDSTVTRLHGVLDTATQAVQKMGLDQPGGLQNRLAQLQQGADALADGSQKLAEGVQVLVDQTRTLGSGLSQASDFLLAMKNDAQAPSMAGFYVPPQLLTEDTFKKAAASFVSADGHSIRYLVQTNLDPFSTAAMDQTNAIEAAARSAQPNTTLSDAKISMAGVSTILRDTRDYYHNDFQFFIVATIMIVLLIMICLLRAIVAPLYLIGSVLISYFSALGLGVLVFQELLGQELHWSVPGLTFILLVAVGADYNLLLISRIRDESPHGIRIGVIRTVASTGGVITSAGLIFAASMLGLMFASITTMLQAGFVIGVGILLDTFVVRTVTVPAMAVIVGKANWWPNRWLPQSWVQRLRARRVKRHRREVNDPVIDEVFGDLPDTRNGHHGRRMDKFDDEDDITSIAWCEDHRDEPDFPAIESLQHVEVRR
ncbi:RND family transporter [Mycobacterium sp. ACS1612]|uniref:MMPL/RND family transporter n=1 Tax=Mycobacterium sp. ACS1612 TaxID=1834117 RepID=UPI0009EF03EC|nr:RND family transporter [Mycobacterium sp. ACS1612]